MTPAQLAKTGSEHGEQAAVFAWAAMAYRYGFVAASDDNCYAGKEYCESTYGTANGVEALDEMFAIPNGGERHKAVAGNLKAEGVKRGIPDIMLPLPVGNAHGLFVEMKKVKDGTVSPEQRDRIARLKKRGYTCYVCKGWVSAVQTIQAYIEGRDGYVSINA